LIRIGTGTFGPRLLAELVVFYNWSLRKAFG
jgi:hypothetical protein